VSARSFIIGQMSYEHPKDQIKVPKVSLMPSRQRIVPKPFRTSHRSDSNQCAPMAGLRLNSLAG